MRIGMIHQPHFLPWPGYIARCFAADVFIVLDSVKFKKNHYHQRTRYVGTDGYMRWLTLPIAHSTATGPISEVRLADSFRLRSWQRPFIHHYKHTANFQVVWDNVCSRIDEGRPSLLAVNLGTLAYLFQMLAGATGANTPKVILGSSLVASASRTDRLRDLCASAGVTHLMMGRDALESHDCEALQQTGLELVRHVYSGDPSRAPRSGVTVLHEILNFGAKDAAARLRSDWSVEPITDPR